MIDFIPQEYPFPEYHDINTKLAVIDTCIKMYQHFKNHDKILISVSGGSDSDCIIHLVCKYFPEYIQKCDFVFVNTGLEYNATKSHLRYLEQKYGIQIQRIRGLSVVTVIKKYGVPILSKSRSSDISYYLRGSKWAIDRIDGDANANKPRYAYTPNMRNMIHFIREHDIRISDRCCYFSKKAPIKKFMKQNGVTMNVTGERRAEKGQRVSAHKTCFEHHVDGVDKYMPIWWWNNDVKDDFKKSESITYSDCYELYGMKRTGCCGCPFNLNIGEDLRIMAEYEPMLYRACMNVFGISYRLMDLFGCRKKKCII